MLPETRKKPFERSRSQSCIHLVRTLPSLQNVFSSSVDCEMQCHDLFRISGIKRQILIYKSMTVFFSLAADYLIPAMSFWAHVKNLQNLSDHKTHEHGFACACVHNCPLGILFLQLRHCGICIMVLIISLLLKV